MSRHTRTQRIFDTPGIYRIRVSGYVDESLSDALGGLSITANRAPGEESVSTLTGSLVDQAALAGLLVTIQELGLVLLSVERIEPDPDLPPTL